MQRIIFSSKTGGGYGLQKNVDSGIIDEFGWGKFTGIGLPTDSPTHQVVYLYTHSLTHPLTHSLTHSLTFHDHSFY